MGKFDEQDKASPPDLWLKWGMQLAANKTPHTNLHNAARILESDPAYKGRIYYDEFLQRVIRRNSPAREWEDKDDLEATRHIQDLLMMPKMGRDVVSQAVISVAHQHPRNCVREWMDGLKWDGTPRVDAFFADCFGAEMTDYSQAASRNFWISMVARVYRPGCKVDNMVILEGDQGVGKSTALQIIGGDWFAEQHESATNPKAFAEILQGKLLIEISEMDAFTNAEVSRVKQTVSCQADRFRASYGRHAVDHPRTCVFVGTTNKDEWNRDETGARRFWPIRCSEVNLEAITTHRTQLFAEAVKRQKANESYWIMPSEATKAEQDERFSGDAWLEQIMTILKGEASITTAKIADKLPIPLERRDRGSEMRIGKCLRFLRWERKRERLESGLAWVYRPIDAQGRNSRNSRNRNPFEDQ